MTRKSPSESVKGVVYELTCDLDGRIGPNGGLYFSAEMILREMKRRSLCDHGTGIRHDDWIVPGRRELRECLGELVSQGILTSVTIKINDRTSIFRKIDGLHYSLSSNYVIGYVTKARENC